MMRKHKGMTLLELMIGIAIVSLLITVVAPGASDLVKQSRVVVDLNNFSAVAQFARFKAVNEQANVTLCPTTDYTSCTTNWRHAKMVFIDTDEDGARGNNEALIATADALGPNNTFSGITSALYFDANGGVSENVTITICPYPGKDSDAAGLNITTYGHIATAIDYDGDGVKQALSGTALSCS